MSFDDGKYEVNHNYMHSLWAILILMAACSFVAQKRWSSIFNNDTLRALLKLPGHENLSVVKKAQEMQPYKVLTKTMPKKELANFKRANESEQEALNKNVDDHRIQQIELVNLSKVNNLSECIDILTGDENEYNHTLDYYSNQLIYLLLPRQTAAYKLSSLNLRRKLIIQSIISFSLTLMQHILPLAFIGKNYMYYGLNFFKAWLKYTLKQLSNPKLNVNSIDYELSSQIFPTSVQCNYKQFGFQGPLPESATVQCTVSINEICGKLFVVIWWFIIINLMIEAKSLLCILIYPTDFRKTRWCIGGGWWSKVRQEAKKLATFRYRHSLSIQNRSVEFSAKSAEANHHDLLDEVSLSNKNHSNLVHMEPATKTNSTDKKKSNNEKIELSEGECKIHEAEAGGAPVSSSCLSAKKWYLWCFKDVGLYLTNKGRAICGKKVPLGKGKCSAQQTNWKPLRDEEGYKESREDTNIYYLLRLLHMRFNGSDKKVERVVRMSSCALEKYLRNFDEMYTYMKIKEG